MSLRNRKLELSRNVFCTGTSPIRMAWTLSLKYLSVKPRLLMKKGWFLEVKSHLGKSFKVSVRYLFSVPNRPRSIYQYSSMAPRPSGQTSIFGVVFFVFKSLLGIEVQKKLAILTRKLI